MTDIAASPSDTVARQVNAVIVGAGGMARHHLKRILPSFPQTDIPVICEPSEAQAAATLALFELHGRPLPRVEPSLARLLAEEGDTLDAAFIITPHVYHHDMARQCLRAGLDVLLEKPMVMTAKEAVSLIETVSSTGRHLVVAFNGSLSPEVRKAATMLRSGVLGEIRTISATVWQNWDGVNGGTWRTEPAIAGGGFMFDTGAHMLNTVADLAGEPFAEVAAWLDNRTREVDILGVVIARLASGALVTLHGSGDTVGIGSDVRVFGSDGQLRTGIWGRWLEVQREGDDALTLVKLPPSLGVWEQFLAVRDGLIENPSPPGVGLRMARLWDAIRASAAAGGRVVSVPQD